MHRRIIRIEREFNELKRTIDSKQLTSVQILENKDFHQCTFLISGPMDSPYDGFWFRIKMEWPQSYPFQAPKCIFMDKIWNPFVDYETNKICLDVLQDQFSPALTMRLVLLSIVSLLSETKITENQTGFANPQAAIQMMKNYPFFHEHANKICEVSSYKRQQIYSNQMRGLPEQHIVEVESHQLTTLIDESLKSKKYNKKHQYKYVRQQIIDLEQPNQKNDHSER